MFVAKHRPHNERRKSMSRSESRRKRRIFAASLTDDERQGLSIEKHNKLVIHAPRLNFTYKLDGFAVPSGKRHRKIG